MVVPNVEFNRSLLGVKHPAGRFPIEREAILKYSSIIGETNPLYTDEDAARAAGYRGLVAPPAFCGLFTWAIGQPDIDLKVRGTGLLASEAFDCLAPVCAGDTLDAITHLKEVYVKTGRSGVMVFVVWAIAFSNQYGELVETREKSFVHVERE